MAAPSGNMQSQHISGITATEGSNVFAGSNTTNNINIGSLADLLPYAPDASFNANGKEDDPFCLPDTRVEVLERIRAWINDDHEGHIFWLSGWAGTGKSTVARTVAREYYDSKHWIASFFFSKGGGDTSNAKKFVSTIAVQLANKSREFKDLLQRIVSEDQGVGQRVLRDQWRELVVGPLSQLKVASLHSHPIIVVDALDECYDESDIRRVLQLLADTEGLGKGRLRVIVTSRPESSIRDSFSRFLGDKHQHLVLHDMSDFVVDRDISLFLRHNLSMTSIDEPIIEQLVQRAAGLFIWAATACRFITEGRRFAARRLAMILEGSSTSVTAPEKHLTDIYFTVLKHAISPSYTDDEKDELYFLLRQTLGSIVVLLSPLSVNSLSKVLGITEQDLCQTLEDLHAILDIPSVPTNPLRLHHPSFRDFLLDEKRCRDRNFFVEEKEAHRLLTERCIQLMSRSLKQDICEVAAPGTPVTDIESARVEQYLPSEVQYACLYWVQHLQKSAVQLHDNDQVHQLLQVHLLHWLEALSWIRKISEGITAIISLQSMATASNCPQLYACIHDMKRFALYSLSAIKRFPLQTYLSAIVFAPVNSIVRRQFEDRPLRYVERFSDIERDWNALLQSLQGHLSGVLAVEFSPDGRLLASASIDKTIRLWDPVTGAALQMLQGHGHAVTGVKFSPDGKQLASTSFDKTVRLWDPVTGALLHLLGGHSDETCAVAFSPNGKLIASASRDNTVRLWNLVSGALVKTLIAHSDGIWGLGFTPDGKLLASASSSYMSGDIVMLWDVGTGTALQTLQSKSFENSLRKLEDLFFPTGKKRVGSLSYHSVWTAWGSILRYRGPPSCGALSPDGEIVTVRVEESVLIYVASREMLIWRLDGNTRVIIHVAISPDGKLFATSSMDEMVRIWDLVTGALLYKLCGHVSTVRGSAFSPDCKLVASASIDGRVLLWDLSVDTSLHEQHQHSGRISQLAFSPDGKLIASASEDNTVRLWHVITGLPLRRLVGHSSWARTIAFSPDSKQLASASADRTVKLWDTTTGEILHTLEGYSDRVEAVAFSLDSQKLASEFDYGSVKLWDTRTGLTLHTLEGHRGGVHALAFSPDSQQLASASGDGTVKLWHTRTGEILHTLEGHLGSVEAVAFSLDSQQLASASYDGTVKLWDTATGGVVETIKPNSDTRLFLRGSTKSAPGTDKELFNLIGRSHSKSSCGTIPFPYLWVNEEWVGRGAENILWLPSDYQNIARAVHGDYVALGHPSGRVSILEFVS